MYCTDGPRMVARAVPGIGSAFVTTLVVAALEDRPATLVLGLKAGAVSAKRTANVEAVKESLGLESHIDPQTLARVEAGFLGEDANGKGRSSKRAGPGSRNPCPCAGGGGAPARTLRRLTPPQQKIPWPVRAKGDFSQRAVRIALAEFRAILG